MVNRRASRIVELGENILANRVLGGGAKLAAGVTRDIAFCGCQVTASYPAAAKRVQVRMNLNRSERSRSELTNEIKSVPFVDSLPVDGGRSSARKSGLETRGVRCRFQSI